MNVYIVSAVAFLLSGCASLGTQFRAAKEAEEGPRARLRVVANMLVKAVPNKACIDWGAVGSGTVLGGIIGSSGYRGRSLSMPPGYQEKTDAAELYVAADKPITLVLLTTPEGVSDRGRKYFCSIAGSFVPMEGKDYEASLFIDPVKRSCSVNVIELGPHPIVVPVQPAEKCRKRG